MGRSQQDSALLVGAILRSTESYSTTPTPKDTHTPSENKGPAISQGNYFQSGAHQQTFERKIILETFSRS